MPKYNYKAVKENGKTYHGTVTAPDRFVVYDKIRKEKGTVISVAEAGRGVSFSMNSLNTMFSTVKTSEKIVFTRNLSAMVKAGIPISRALSVMERQTKNPKLKATLYSVRESVKKGKSLHESFGKHPRIFSKLFVSMVRAGEESGKFVEALQSIGNQMKRAYALNKRIKGALTYPTIILGAMVVIGILMLAYVVPTLSQTFKELNAELPKSTQAIITTSDFLSEHTLIAIVLIIGFGVLVWMLARTRIGKRFIDYTVLHIPVIEVLVQETNSARTARTLSSLLASGVEVVMAIGITQEVIQNSYYKTVLSDAEQIIKKGKPISTAFTKNTHLYPVLVGEMIAVGEETGRLSDMLNDIADFYEEEVEQKTKNLSTIIEPFLMIIIGSAVGFFALSMITPIYSISQSI